MNKVRIELQRYICNMDENKILLQKIELMNKNYFKKQGWHQTCNSTEKAVKKNIKIFYELLI